MLKAYRLPPQLSPWLDGAVCMRMDAGQGVSRFPAMPRAMLTMHLIRVEGVVWPIPQPALFHTLTTQPTTYTHSENITALGLIIRPSAAACLLGRACGAMSNQVVPWSVIAGEPEAVRLADEVERLRTDTGCLQALMDSFVRAMHPVTLERFQQAERVCAAVGRFGAQAGDILGLGRRQLERRCLAVLGISPKQLERLERFRSVLSAVVTQDALPSAQTALDAGYYDQSHLALDARQLGGASIREMQSLAAPGTPWWALSTPRAIRDALDRTLF
jgi:hypothetical protein